MKTHFVDFGTGEHSFSDENELRVKADDEHVKEFNIGYFQKNLFYRMPDKNFWIYIIKKNSKEKEEKSYFSGESIKRFSKWIDAVVFGFSEDLDEFLVQKAEITQTSQSSELKSADCYIYLNEVKFEECDDEDMQDLISILFVESETISIEI